MINFDFFKQKMSSIAATIILMKTEDTENQVKPREKWNVENKEENIFFS